MERINWRFTFVLDALDTKIRERGNALSRRLSQLYLRPKETNTKWSKAQNGIFDTSPESCVAAKNSEIGATWKGGGAW
jgi:hypothetical protein